MNWEQLLSLKRQGDTGKRLRKEQNETRLGFEVDYDRIIFSSAFRSLQDKTQVFPMPIAVGSQKDFVHTRLTHSLEVSVVGRSLGRIAGQQILTKYPFLSEVHGHHFNDFGAIVAAAALAHDIGNPPFGHSGEKAIGNYFKQGKGKQYKDILTAAEYQDLIDFEGNANGFKLLTESREGVPGGLRLSYATLGAFIKYPKASLPKKPSKSIVDKKFGFFQSEKSFFNELVEEIGLLPNPNHPETGFLRHPLTYLVEAADDICYTIIDFEDGINLGLIPEEYALEYLINLVKDNINTKKYNAMTTSSDRLSYLRALAISTLIGDAVDVFVKNEDKILDGVFDVSLLDKGKYKAQVADIIKLSVEKIYQSTEVVDKELAGYRIISDLLDMYTTALINVKEGEDTNYDRLLIKSLPKNYQNSDTTIYKILLNTSCFVASLSDSAAVHIHDKLTGRKI
ncbi:dGTP triphosphohydrolase [Flagellimonas halotolerans]|uniref:DNTP triphosphohydrolase n=1 Tax=Flagellimonas halotolerans TaxID=3112164 RepID=A0ABU6ILL6_9FLAO|nr:MULTISPECIES: dNTP triphosphohydrolase [unclassified Allomuricauda]MEC3964130.1 dNTP triphosphohydrolase [Muricauda sp. SYSU M86414]MEC4264000.1 dNTP triphosphohydrolase [Muricauda sp. SYSU M84420]